MLFFEGVGSEAIAFKESYPETAESSGRGGSQPQEVITPANFHEESWYNPLEACFSPLPSTGGEIFFRHREISTVEGGDEHEPSPNRCPCLASRSSRDHGSGQQEEIIGRSRGGVVRIPETVSGPLFFLPVGLSNHRNIRNAVEGNHGPQTENQRL